MYGRAFKCRKAAFYFVSLLMILPVTSYLLINNTASHKLLVIPLCGVSVQMIYGLKSSCFACTCLIINSFILLCFVSSWCPYQEASNISFSHSQKDSWSGIRLPKSKSQFYHVLANVTLHKVLSLSKP